MISQRTSDLRKRILGFLKQRRRAYQLMYAQSKNPRMRVRECLAGTLENKFDLICGYSHWRHCREVVIRKAELMELLPSEHGKHAAIRLHMLELIEECELVSSEAPKKDFPLLV